MRKLLKRVNLRKWTVVTIVILALAVAGALLVPLPARLSERPSTLVRFADDSVAHVFLAPDDRWRIRADLERIDPDYVAALLAFEDARFFVHPGVDPFAILRAIGSNLRAGRVVSGASTITMQLVRLVEPRPRHLGSKITEALRAVQLELRLSKEEILAHYLTFTPYGGNLEGIEAASWAYFGHSAEALAPDEVVVLLAVPQRPWHRAPSPRNVARLEQARNEIAARLIDAEALHPGNDEGPAGLLSRIAASPTPFTLRPMPREMPHLARWLADRNPQLDEISTTIDRGQQRLAERILHGARTELRDRGIHNAAAILVDHRDGHVRAVVGNLNFWDEHHGGQIPAFSIPRSPGSALKPFLFALAIDRGIALPEHLVPDIPSSWGGWRPENADGQFHGLVSLGGALSTSLNVPFIRLLGEVGVEPFLGTLSAAGASELSADPARLGLSAAIGGAEVSALEVAALYATLAHDGVAVPLTFERRGGDAQVEPRRVFSSGAAWLTRRVLARRDRPDFPSRRELSGAPAQIHWKTGTSWGRRDAWAAGSGPTHTAVVWLGNVDASPSADLVGADAAGPLLFDLLEALRPARPPIASGPPTDLVPVRACSWSGYLPAAACPTTREILALRSRVPTKACPYHVEVDVDLDRGLALNPSCRSGRRWQSRPFLQLPATVARFLAERHRSLPAPPNLAPECLAAGAGRPPTILTPPVGQVIVLVRGLPDDRQEVPLEAESPRPGGRLSWWIDGRWLGTVVPPERLWWTPEPGEHELAVIDETGATARRRVQVVRR